MVSVNIKATFVLIGGGNTNLKSEKPYETEKIDKTIVKLADKKQPNFLFIGLASSFSDAYYDNMKKIYQSLGCKCQYLKKKNIINNPQIVEKKIKEADIIYFAGGDTIKLKEQLEEYNINTLLEEKIKQPCVIAGISAGAMILCNQGLSDSMILREKSDKYILVEGLKFVDINICPHYNKEERKKQLKEMIKNEKIYSIDNKCAIVISQEKYSVIQEEKDCNAYICYKKNENWIEEKI